MNAKEEIKKDFEESIKRIDFSSYNPMSQEFMSAVMIGLMSLLIDDNSEVEIKEEKQNDDISEEFAGAKKYLQKYIETKDPSYRDMTLDELKHGNFLIKKAYAKLPSNEEKEKLKGYEQEYREILEQVK